MEKHGDIRSPEELRDEGRVRRRMPEWTRHPTPPASAELDEQRRVRDAMQIRRMKLG